jgi:hypothetical protein
VWSSVPANDVTCASKRTVAKTAARGKTEPNQTNFQKQHAEGVGFGAGAEWEIVLELLILSEFLAGSDCCGSQTPRSKESGLKRAQLTEAAGCGGFAD